MTEFFFLIPVALLMGLAGLGAFLWALKSGQYEDLDGAAVRILIEDDPSQTAGKLERPERRSQADRQTG